MPYEEEVKTWPQYEPKIQEKKVVTDLQKQGAPQSVYYVDRGAGATAEASKSLREIWFFKSNEKEYHGTSESIVSNPELALLEMQSAGVVS